MLNKGDTSLGDRRPGGVDGGRPGVRRAGTPHEVVASADGRTAYISNYGGFGAGLHTISRVDLTTGRPLRRSTWGRSGRRTGWHGPTGRSTSRPRGARRSGGTTRPRERSTGCWAVPGAGADAHDRRLGRRQADRHVERELGHDQHSRVDAEPRRRRRPAPGATAGRGQRRPARWRPRRRPRRPVHRRAAAAITLSGPRPHVPVGAGPEGFDVSPDGKQVWAANSQRRDRVGGRRGDQVGRRHADDPPPAWANRLKFTPDGKRVFISDLGGTGVVVVDVATRKEVQRIKLGRGAAGILMQPGRHPRLRRRW